MTPEVPASVREAIARAISDWHSWGHLHHKTLPDAIITNIRTLPAPDRLALCAVLLPDGWVAVPRAPTLDMLRAGDRNSGMMHFLDEMFDEDRQKFIPALQLAYEAMIAASPTTDTPEKAGS